jgi:TRAP-type C4-dicarboxylate transport system substrate-binding protein
MKRNFVYLCCLLFLLFAFFVPTPSNASEKVTKLLFSSAWPPPPNVIGQPIDWFMNELEKRSNGRVKFEKHWGGSFTTGAETLEHLKSGTIDMGGMAWLYNPGLTPVGMVEFGLPFGTTDIRMAQRVKKEFYKRSPEFQEEMKRYKIIPVVWLTSPARDLITRFPVNSLDDLKGKKLGAAGNYLPKYVAAAGAVGAHAPMTEAYMMMDRGVIEGQLLHIDLIYAFKLYEVCKYYTRVGLASTVYQLFGFNSDAFNRLPKDIQTLSMQISEEADNYFCDWLEKQVAMMEEALKKSGVRFNVLPKDDRAKWMKNLYNAPAIYAEELEKKGLPGWKMIRSYAEIMKEQGHVFPADWELPKK